MLVGFIAGILYSLIGFGNTGDEPTLNITLGPFRNGHLIIGGYHIHHWVIYLPLTVLGARWGYPNVSSFSFVMTVQGLSYADRFEFNRHI